MKINNWPLLMLALEYIIKHADKYHQGKWRSDCGSTRCVAGWIAYFAGWRDILTDSGHFIGVNRTGLVDDPTLPVEDAALISLELDPEIYGVEFEEGIRKETMEDLAMDLFGGYRSFEQILGRVHDLMAADGVTPTPLIRSEMARLGITMGA